MNAQDTIKIGDMVRSFDFSCNRSITGKDACFIEGVVVGVGSTRFAIFNDCRRYTIEVTRRVFGGVAGGRDGGVVYPPVNGTPTMLGDVCDYVERL